MSIDAARIAAIAAKAEKATPGPWRYVGDDNRLNGSVETEHGKVATVWNAGGAAGRFIGQGRNGPCIAACDPQTVLALCALAAAALEAEVAIDAVVASSNMFNRFPGADVDDGLRGSLARIRTARGAS